MQENQEYRHKKIVLFPQDRSLCSLNDTFIPGVPGQKEKQKWPTSGHLPLLRTCTFQKSLPHLRTSENLLPIKGPIDARPPKKTDVFLFRRALRARAIPGRELLLPDIGPPSRPFANPLQRKGRVCTDAARFLPIKNTPRSCAARPSSFKSER